MLTFQTVRMKTRTHDNRLWFRPLFKLSIAFRASGRWRHWWCIQSHEFKITQHIKIACYVIRVTKLWQTGCPHRRPLSFSSYLFLCRFDRAAVSVSAPFFVPFRQSSVGECAVFCTFFLIGFTVIPYGNYGLRACRSFSKVSNSEQKGPIVSKVSNSEQNFWIVSKTFE